MIYGHYEFVHWFLALVAPLAVTVWPFKRGEPAEPEQDEPVPTSDQAEGAVIDHMDWGIRLGMLGRFERAAERFEQAAHADPKDPAAHYNHALALDLAGDHERARDLYNRAIEIDPDFADIHTNLALARLDLGDSRAAIESLNRARELDPGDAVVHFNLGCIYLSQELWQNAAAELTQAVKCDPKDAQIRFNLAIALRRTGHHEDAERELRDFLALARGRYPEQREFAEKLISDESTEE
jgi:Flp pilus assembly protein TadD